MLKPRIVIADTDYNYIIPLQHKFIVEYESAVNLEIITDKDYFENFFSTPQRIDILVVSEALYNEFIHRHDIANVFVMTETAESLNLNGVNSVFKYTSIKEIFNEIVGKSSEKLTLSNIGKKETRVIMFYSVSGGVGKTTVAMGVAEKLGSSYRKVLYINASGMHTFQQLLKDSTPITSTAIYAKLSLGSEDIYSDIKQAVRKDESFSYLPPFKAPLLSLGLDHSIYKSIIAAAKKSGDYDYIVVDTESTFSESNAQIMDMADKVVVLTQQSRSYINSLNILVSNINRVGSEKYMFICNKFNKDEPNALVSDIHLDFSVTDYIETVENCDNLNPKDISLQGGIQRLAMLIE